MGAEASPSVVLSTRAIPLIINGEEIARTGDGTFDVLSPNTETSLWHCTSASKDDALAAVESASKAFPDWSATKASVRRDLFLRAATLLEERAQELAQYQMKETGATEWFALHFDVAEAIEALREVAGKISSIYGAIPSGGLGDESNSLVLKEPYGVILAIAPWNAPYILGFRSVIYALAAGNTCVLKGSELSPRCFWAIGDILSKAGFPPGCVNILYHRTSDAPEITRTLIEHAAIRKVNFTGSTKVGRIVAEVAGRSLKPCLLELGGKASAIVLEDADIAAAAVECVKGAFFHSGQICMSTERILIHRDIFPVFKTALQEAMAQIAPMSQPLVLAMTAGVERHRRLVAQASSAGAEIISDESAGKGSAESQFRMRPALIVGVNRNMDVYHEESFGPSVSLIQIGSEEEAVRIANDTEYGLSASVFTKDLRRALKLAKRIQTGAVHVNSMTIYDHLSTPHGGIKDSGWGRFNGQWGMEEFLKLKTVTFR